MMKNAWMLGATLGLSIVSGTVAVAEVPAPPPELVTLTPERTFVPPGFDSNDRAQVVMSAMFINSCFKAAPAEVRVDQAAKKIFIKNRAYFYRNSWCLQILVPYVQVAELGVLPAGNYQIIGLDKNNREYAQGALPIIAARSQNPDDQLYAAVDQAYIDGEGSAAELTLGLTLGSDCMNLKEVQLLYRAQNIIEVLPVAETTGENCKPIPHRMETRVKLNSPWRGQTLVHIRSVNGQSINRVYDF